MTEEFDLSKKIEFRYAGKRIDGKAETFKCIQIEDVKEAVRRLKEEAIEKSFITEETIMMGRLFKIINKIFGSLADEN